MLLPKKCPLEPPVFRNLHRADLAELPIFPPPEHCRGGKIESGRANVVDWELTADR